MSGALATASLALLAAAPFLPALLGQRVLFQRDVVSYWLPTIEVFVRQAAAGELPLWNPGTGFGAPLWADPNFQWAYPTTWLNLLLPPGIAFAGLVAAHAVLGALGARRLAQAAGIAPLAAFVAGAAFAWSGPWLSSATLWHHYCSVAWAPWVLLALKRLVMAPRSLPAIARLGACAGMAALAGSADACLMILLLAVLWLPALLRASPSRRRAVASLAAATALAAGLAAVQWLPTLHILDAGSRAAMPASARLYWSVHPASLIDLAVPRLVVGQPWGEQERAVLFEGREPLIDGLYVGAGVLVLAAVAIATAERAARARGLAVVAALLVVVSLGRHAPLAGLLSLPGFAQLRYPAKFLWLLPLLLALLAGLGLHAQAVAPPRSPRLRRVAAGGLVTAACLALAGVAARAAPAWTPWLATGADLAAATHSAVTALAHAALAFAAVSALLLWASRRAPGARPSSLIGLVTLLDLAAFATRQNPLGPPELLHHVPPVVHALRAAGPGRVLVASRSRGRLEDRMRFGPAGWEVEARFVLGLQEMLMPPAAARWGLEGSFDGDFTGLAPRAMSALSFLARGQGVEEARGRLLRLAGVRYVVSFDERVAVPAAALMATFPSVFDRPVRLFRLPEPVPRARAVCAVRRLDDGAALTRIAGGEFDPMAETTSAVLAPRSCPEGFRAGVAPVARGPATSTWDVDASHPAVLVVTEAAFPGWGATVDGEAALVHTADLLFRAVEVPAGRHRVTLEYRPPGFVVGWSLAVLAATALLWLAWSGDPAPAPSLLASRARWEIHAGS